jgi:dethiobiotin synthetase
VKRSCIFITGTDTGVGKTLLTCLLVRHLLIRGESVAAMKPVCSGGRGDAERLHLALSNTLTLDQINPWHFRASLTPLLAARRERRKVRQARVLAQIHRIQKQFSTVLVEGAGGLLSPMGEDFDSRDLMLALDATPVVLCPNRLGAINQVLLVLAALPASVASRARIVLTSSRIADAASRSNLLLLREMLGRWRVHALPWLKSPQALDRCLKSGGVQQTISSLVSRKKIPLRPFLKRQTEESHENPS